MKKGFYILFVCLLAELISTAQQRPHYTQYMINPFIINPALAGIDNYADMKLSARDQWVGLKGAPRTVYATLQGPIGKNDYRTSSTSYAIPGQNPRGKAYWENYTAAEPHHGAGATVINDKTGSFNFFSASLSYAYHLGLSPKTNISAGLSAGITTVKIDRTQHDFSGTGDPFDPATGTLNYQQLKKIRPQMAAGLWLYSSNYYIGFAAQNVIPQTLVFAGDNPSITTKGKFVPHLFLTGGYRFMIGDDYNVTPSLMLKYIKGSAKLDFQPELNTKIQYRDLLWIGGSYRYKDSYAGMLGIHFSNAVTISYAYEKSLASNPLNSFNSGTHELVIGFSFGNKYSEACPRCY